MASRNFPVAVIGTAVRLPGAKTCDEFWQVLLDGKDTVREFPTKRANDIAHVVSSFKGKLLDEDHPFFTGSFFDEVEQFDADVFQINPGEALYIEPEQRFFLEVTWELLEDAGYASTIKGSRTGVYVGNTVNKYKYVLTENHPSISHGNHSPFISSRVSYTHDLHGPSMMVATGCSSSLLAVHLACQGLLSGDCDMAIAGGITLDLLPISTKTDIWNQLGITGRNVKCRAFDKSANGIAKGEGCGVVLLKPLSKALQDNDHIYGILEATTANQDGHSNGITAPHPVAQANMLQQAWKLADICPDDLGYFEAHGTGTELGDPIEISGITNAFKKSGVTFPNELRDKVPIGSVKANIGHLADGAAGVVSLIKTLLCINKKQIPGQANFTEPNPHINWEKAPVYVNTSTIGWAAHEDKSARIASVSAFGLLGTNIHVVVREHVKDVTEPYPNEPSQMRVNVQVLALSANSKTSLKSYMRKLLDHFNQSDDTHYTLLRNICYTVNTGREHSRFKYRAVAVGEDWESMRTSLERLQGSALYSKSGVWYAGEDVDQTNLRNEVRETVAMFGEGKTVNWSDCYLDVDRLSKIPGLPTYAFDRKRFWPKLAGPKPINTELLHMEHQLQEQIDTMGSLDDGKEDTYRISPQFHQPDEIIKQSLNVVFGTEFDWAKHCDTNLFMLGLDSLMFTQVCMNVRTKIGCSVSMSEFHGNPTFLGLKSLIDSKMNQNETSDKDHKSIRTTNVSSVIGEILNDVLGKDFRWADLRSANLFTLGIDSLLCTHINMKLADTFGVEITFIDLHNNPTFGGLCEIILQALKKGMGGTQQPTKIRKPILTSSTQLPFVKTPFPVSFAQRRLWVMQEMGNNPCAYNATNCIQMTGNFHHKAFCSSVNAVLARHGAFYTEFDETEIGLMQRHIREAVTLEEICLLQSSDDRADAMFMNMYDEDYKTAFDLRKAPLVRCKLYSLPNEVFFFTVIIHHIVFDGWSHFTFYNELWDTYRKSCDGRQVDTSLHRPLYVEYAEDEQNDMKALSSSSYDTDLAYWMNNLSGDLPLTTFPGDKRRPAVFTYNGGRITRFLSNDVIRLLDQFAADRYTMFMSLLAAVYVLIHRYTGDTDLIIGSPIAGRSDMKYKDVIGCFINTLVLRLQIDGSFSFKDVLEAVSKVCIEANDHQRTPFDHLINQLNLPRNTSITPLFSINVCYHNTEAKASHVDPPSDICVERKLIHNNSSKWDMQFDFLQEKEGTRFTLEYYNDVFSQIYAENLANHFTRLLEIVCHQPTVAIADLDLAIVNTTEIKMNHGDISLIHGKTRDLGEHALPELLMESLLTNGNDSMVFGTDRAPTTYRMLMTSTEKIALFLRDKCQFPKQTRIGLLLDNSVQALESILACLFSGLVYVPMDPSAPKSRLEHICRAADLGAIIYHQSFTSLANHLQWVGSSVTAILCVDSEQNGKIEDYTETPLMDTELWDCVASEATNEIQGGGWMSSYTGEYMSEEEMQEYSENVMKKLDRYLKPYSRVLEIGCASGLTTKMIRHRVKHYVATDLSQKMVDNLRNTYKAEEQLEVHCTAADRIDEVCKGQRFDVIIMNSVVHCFPGHNYLRKVIKICKTLLSDSGVLFIGDIMDLECKENLIASLRSFKESRPTYKVKTEWHNELFLSRKCLQHICDTLLPSMKVSFSRKIGKTPNELTDFRFDATFVMKASAEHIDCQYNTNRHTHGVYTLVDVDHNAASKEYEVSGAIHSTVRNWCRDVDFQDEAYILYTSGTTGIPKGVIIGHEALLNYVSWARRSYKMDKQTCMPLFSPLTFDFTITSIFPPLLGGSSIHIFENFQDSYQDIASCKELTTVKLSPLQLDTILSSTAHPLHASTFILGGEELTPNLLLKLKKNKPKDEFVVWNEYGPTEATVGCVVKEISSDILPLDSASLVSIGQPIDNVTVAVLGTNTKPLPVGGKGVLGIGGKSLCLGFTGKPVCSSIKAACWGRPGNQMLLTEDLAELTPTSNDIVYCGRQDSDSTKVNGIRMDLVEVQQALETSDIVLSAWVTTFEFEIKTYLGAAIKLNPKVLDQTMRDSNNWKNELINTVSHILPDRSIPKMYIAVTEAPTNRNGKKDSRLLQRMLSDEMAANHRSEKDKGHEAIPGCPQITKLQEIWESILPVSHLPQVDENFFFDLSGDSLQAIHLTRKMRAEGFNVSVTDIFQNPTIEQLLPVLLTKANKTTVEEKKDMLDEHNEVDTEFKPTPIIEDFLKTQTRPDRFSLSALLRFEGEVSSLNLRRALRSVITKHASLRSQFELSDGKAVQRVRLLHPDEPTIKEITITSNGNNLVQLSEFADVCEELENLHSLSKGVILTCALITLDGEYDQLKPTPEVYVLLAAHHAAVDIVSWQQIMQDLALSLKNLENNSDIEPMMIRSSVSFQRYCSALYGKVSGGFSNDIPYWTATGTKCETAGKLVDGDVRSTFESAQWVNEAVDAHVLRSISTTLGTSDEHVLLTVFGRALSLKHGCDTTAVCLESHGRQLESVDTTETVGWFTSRFPIVVNTPITGDLVQQVKDVQSNVTKIPNRGLSFGVLKSAGKLNVPIPKIMFVYQGSLDASSKEMFDGGDHRFEYIPWIDVMKDELKQGRFHRHPGEVLEFDLEIISWIHSGTLQLGCLFDEKKVSCALVQDVVHTASRLITTLAKRVFASANEVKVSILPQFNITPECVTTIEKALGHHDIASSNVTVYPPEQVIQSLYKICEVTTDILVVIPRPKTNKQAEEFAEIFDQTRKEIDGSRSTILMTTEHIPHTAKVNIQNTSAETDVVIPIPEFIGTGCYDSNSDEMYAMPFTSVGYTYLGLTIARAVNALVGKKKYKVVAVDADYTLWEGQCAQGDVTINSGNRALQKYLLKLKNSGMLLVILSKNETTDIDKVFANQDEQMILKETDFVSILANWDPKPDNIKLIASMLNIGLDSFVFIDDNVLECEQMLRACPSVLTLQLPSCKRNNMVSFLVDNLWSLDVIHTTNESRERTELYRKEFTRQKELQTVQSDLSFSGDLTDLLQSWNMKLTICKCTISSIMSNPALHARVIELLQRTNQFKLNDANLVLEEMSPTSVYWIAALSDIHGQYGIVSIGVLSNDTDTCKTLIQWVVSCRALGRQVEERIFREMQRDTTGNSKATVMCVAVNQTNRNTPMLRFLEESLGVKKSEMLPDIQNVTLQPMSLQEPSDTLHKIEFCKSVTEFERDWCQARKDSTAEIVTDDPKHLSTPQLSAIHEITDWIESTWTTLQKDQATYHYLYPLLPKCARLDTKIMSSIVADECLTFRENALKQVWMEVLQDQHEPQEQSNFIESGGNSFKAVFLVSKLKRTCGVDVNIVDILRNPVYCHIKSIVLQAQRTVDQKEETSSQPKLCFPCSSPQQRMVILQQTSPKSTAYVETIACYANTKITDATTVIKLLIDKHPILTATIHMSDDKKTFTMKLFGCQPPSVIGTETPNGHGNVDDYLTESIPVIDVISSPLYRFRHVTTEAGQSLFVLHVHHVIIDDITLRNLAKDLESIISDESQKTTSNKHQHQHYSDLVQDEHMYSSTADHQADQTFWKQSFAILPPEVNLGNRSESGQNNTVVYNAKEETRELQQQSVEEIKKYCTTLGITEFQYFLACTSLVLQRYLGVNDFIIAIPVTIRNDVFSEVDGLFVNTVLFRCEVNQNQTIHEFIKETSDQWLKTQRHSRYPLDQVAMSLWKENGKSLNTLCRVMFNVTTQCQTPNALRVRPKHAKMPLSIDINYDEKRKTYKLTSEWADTLLDNGVAERLFDTICTLSSTVFGSSELPIANVEILSPREIQLLESFNNDTEHVSTRLSTPVHIEFEKHAARDSKVTAVFVDGISTSYGELNSMSQQIAHFLRDRLSEEDLQHRPVVMVMKRDQYAIASIMGIWKVGGHFLPVAISNESCLKDIFARDAPAAVLVNQRTDTINSIATDCPIWCTDDILQCPYEKEDISKKTHAYSREHNIAYVIRTSGSTGQPKQCKISHQSLRTVAEAWKHKYRMTEFNVNVLQWAPFSFDVFIGDVVRALVCVQGQLTICPDTRRLDIPFIRRLIREQQVTVFETTPQFGHQIIENTNAPDIESIKIFILGSDVLQEHVYTQIKERLTPSQRLLNSYGMTEATIDSSYFESDVVPKTRSGTVPIGKPLPGITMHILDTETLQSCPVGTVGELYISGDVIATGDVEIIQLNHSTTQALKTGDAACWLPSGDVELIGRLDSMIKLRGFRISTTEIENKLVELIPGVNKAHVLVSDADNDGVQFLCAFLVMKDHSKLVTITHQDVCNKLRSKVPHYMVPDRIHVIQDVPLTPHGKINKNALPNVSNSPLMIRSEKPQSSSSTTTILKLQNWFAEALGLGDRNAIDNDMTFMEQGGHSLILVRFWSLITSKSTFKVEIADLFSYPTISSLAEFIEHHERIEYSNDYYTRSINASDMSRNDEDIAITGIGMRLPGGVMSLAELWEILQMGSDLIGDFPKSRTRDVLSCLSTSSSYDLRTTDTFKGAFLKEIDHFDNGFFKIAPGEAKFMSPEQRLFLEVATEALAEGNSLSSVKGSKVGVFVGHSEVEYSNLSHPDNAICVSGLLPGMIASRVAYQWDLKGPTMLIDTACSSSLTALKQACESIQRQECAGALVGGVNIVLYPSKTGVFGQSSILSPDFHCRAFDKDATGTAVGEGIMCLYVEPLSTAIAKGKPVYAVVKSIASNSVGHGNGITAPSSNSQTEVIKRALQVAHMIPSDINFVEGHGTGTNLGDRIEISALSSVFNQNTRAAPLPIGSVKSVYGHLDSAAGLLGVLKVLAGMVSKKIAPTANFKSPHPELIGSPLEVTSTVAEWTTGTNRKRAAGVSAFGLTGTNCHAILVEDLSSTIQVEDEVNKSGPYPLIFIGETMEHVKKQFALCKTYVEQMIVRNGTSTLSSLCLAMAQRFVEYQYVRKNPLSWRMVINVASTTQLLKLLNMVISSNDTDYVMRLATMRSDIHLWNPHHTSKIDATHIKSFLQEGEINISDLFHGTQNQITPALGVNVAFYEESRHWLDPRSSTTLRSSYEGNLIDLFESKLIDVREMVRTLPVAPADDLEQILKNFCSAIVVNLLLSTDIADKLRTSQECSLDDAFSSTGMLAKYRQLFFVMIRELWENDLVQSTGHDDSRCCLDTFKFKCQSFILGADTEAIAKQGISKYPSWADCFRFPLYCSKYLRKVLWGNMDPLSVIYPQGDLNFMYQFDKLGDLLGDVYYNMYMQVIAEHVNQLSRRGKRVRVLEVGAGVGHVTRQLLPKLKDTPNVEYWFTDLGKAFVEHAKTLFSEYLHMMKFSTFDITQSAPKQGLLGSFDVVISYNVIHTTQSINDSVSNLKSCIGDDGTLFIIESARNDTWSTLAWGILDGWWYFKDHDLRPHEPMLTPETWEQVLSKAGFGSVYSCPRSEEERNHVEKFLFLCSAASIPHLSADNECWWETDVGRFDPIKRCNEVEECKEENKATISVDENVIYQELGTIWRELLGINHINSDDTFNSLGGESLLAIQMMNLVRKRIGYQLEIADTFGYPTLNSLAKFITSQLQDEIKEKTNSASSSAHTVLMVCSESIDLPVIATSNIITPSNTVSNCSMVSTEGNLESTGLLLMFPGQGSQKQGMCLSLKESPEARQIFDRAKEVLGYDLFEIFLKNGDTLVQNLKSTEFVQVSLLVSCIAKIEQLRIERPKLIEKVTHVAGLSVGEFAALVFSGVMTFESALRVVQERGRAMELEVQKSPTGMVSVFGISCQALETYLLSKFPDMRVSTYLADNQHTVAGTEQECCELAQSLAEAFKGEMVDVRKLRVAGAFHSRYMSEASKVIDPLIEGIEFNRPSLPLIMNASGKIVEEPKEIKSLLCEQLVCPVQWKNTVVTAYEAGVRDFIEVAPARVLSSIVKSRIAKCSDCNVELITV